MRRQLITLGISIVLGGCGTEGMLSSAPDQKIPSHVADSSLEHKVARSMAISLAREEVRLAVRGDMRASPWTDHKLSLVDYVTGGNSLLRDRMRRAMGEGASQFNDMIRQFPPYDFSMTREEDRLTWSGTSNYLVAVAPRDETSDPVIAFAPDGSKVILRTPQDIGHRAVFLIQPAEFKNIRLSPQSASAGEVIQDPDDGRIGGQITLDVNGKSMTVDFSDGAGMQRMMQCPPDLPNCAGGGGGGGGGGSGGSEGSTYVEELQTFNICDNGAPFCSSNELEFKGKWQYNSYTVHGIARITGVPGTGTISSLHTLILSKQPTDFLPVTIVSVQETDFIGDDNYCDTPHDIYDDANDSHVEYYQQAPIVLCRIPFGL